MAKQYRQMIEHHNENTGSAGAWNSFGKISKLTNAPQIHSGYVDKVRINYILDDIVNVDGGDSIRSSFPFGVLFAASYEDSLFTIDGDANQLAPDHMVAVTARNGSAGSVTLPIKRRIMENADDVSEKDGYIYLWMKTTDLTTDDTLKWRMYIETFGRWVETNGL